MSVHVEHLDTHEAIITIDISTADMEKAKKSVSSRLSKDYRFPGFRPGKVPVSMIESAFGEQTFQAELASELAKMLYTKALAEAKISPYAPGTIENLSMDPPALITRVSKIPTVDLKDYKSIRLAYIEPTVSEDEIQSQLEAIAEDNAIIEAVDRPAQSGDWIEGTVVAYSDTDTALFDLEEKHFLLDEEIEKTMHLEGLAAQIQGMSAGDNRSARLKIDNSEEDETLRGTEVRVEISLERVNKREVPALDDTLAQTVGAYENIGQLRERITSQLMDYKTQMAQREYQNAVLNLIESNSEITLPPKYMDHQVDEALKEFIERIKQEQKIDYEDWLKLNGMTNESARETLVESVTKQARLNLVLGSAYYSEGVSVTDQELNEALDQQVRLAKASGVDISSSVRNAAYRDNMGTRMLTEKVVQRLVDIAQGKFNQTHETRASQNPAPTPI